MEIKINLWNDYIALLRNNLNSSGFVVTGKISDENIFISFFNWQKRKIQAVRRKIYKSREFNCPAQFSNALKNIIDCITTGGDITPYLSKCLRRLDYSDPMLNDWGVHHLHLGDNIDVIGFIERTGPLLFVKFTADSAYLVNIYSHNAWAKLDIVEIIHSNWPEIIAPYKVENVIDLAFTPNDENVKALRKTNINTMLQLKDGTVYAPIGRGYMSNGTATDVMQELTNTRRILRKAEDEVKKDVRQNQVQFADEDILKFHLEFNGESAHAVEENTRIAYKLW
jgi:hypothetical protein